MPKQWPKLLDSAYFLEGKRLEDVLVFFPTAAGQFHEKALLLREAVPNVFAWDMASFFILNLFSVPRRPSFNHRTLTEQDGSLFIIRPHRFFIGLLHRAF